MALGKYYEDNCELANEYYKNLSDINWWNENQEQDKTH